MIVLLLFSVLIFLLFINIPIAISIALATVAAMVAKTGPQYLVNTALAMYNGAKSFPLIAIPLFILAGAIMNSSGISRRLIAFASACIGFIKGGLSMVTIATSMFFAEISGSAVADASALGSVLIPAMKNKGYSPAYAASVVSSASSLAIIIPPSIPMILYAVIAGCSVEQLFVAGFIPGFLGGFLMMACLIFMQREKIYLSKNLLILKM